MKIERIAIEKLTTDPSNVRKHSDKNLSAIKGSLNKFGQQKPIVVTKNGVIIAGNGTYTAAKELGWETIDVVYTELNGTDLTAFGIADNRTSELAEWDDEGLAKMLESLKIEGFDISQIGFDDNDIQNPTDAPSIGIDNLPKEFIVIINCKDEQEQQLLFEEFQERQLNCKII